MEGDSIEDACIFTWINCLSSVCLQIVTVTQQKQRCPSVCSSADSEPEELLPVLLDHSQILNEHHLEQVSVLLRNDSLKYACTDGVKALRVVLHEHVQCI